MGLDHHVYGISLSEFQNEFPQIVLEMAGPTPSFTPYFLGRAMKQLYPSAKVLLCGEGADEFFVGYPLFLDSTRFWSDCFSRMTGAPASWINESPLLQQVCNWKSLDDNEAWLKLIDLFQRAQLVNLHLLPFDHGTMAHGVECRVPYLDHEVVQFVRRVPTHLHILGSTTKVMLRIWLAQALGPDSSLAQCLLTRRSSPAFYSTIGCRNWLSKFLQKTLPATNLAQSELARFAMDQENLFWLASLSIIFLKHRGRIDGLWFPDLVDEIFSEPWVPAGELTESLIP
jgi:asparagine synthase (glutamine-hydrolysing)